jgi:hypothetical protein
LTRLEGVNRGTWIQSPLVRLVSRAVPVVLFAVYPVLLLLGENVGEVTWGDLLLPLAVSVGGGLLAYAVLSLVLRDPDRAAVLATAGLIAVFSFGYVRDGLDPIGPSAGIVLAGYALVGLALLVVVVLRKAGWSRVSRALTVVGAILVALAVVPVVSATGSGDSGTVVRTDIGGATRSQDRDIYLIVLDRYASEHTARTVYDVEDPLLYRRLPELGFTVLPDSGANYPRTLLSLASSLNVDYLDKLVVGRGAEQRSQQPYVDLLQDPAVGRFLQQQGYTYAHVGSWWEPTKYSTIADVNPRFEVLSDFQSTLAETTILPEIATRVRRLGLPIPGGSSESGRRHYEAARFGLDQLDDVAAMPGPTFAIVHILLPHEPFVFDTDGSFVPLADRKTRTRAENYQRQLAYTDERIATFLESVLDVPEDEQPIVMVQADEGPFPVRYEAEKATYAWLDATPEELDEKFGILNAFYLPGDEAPVPYPGMSPVNGFRLVLGAYFGADLPLLPDRHYVFRDAKHQYDLLDMTDRIQGVLAAHE